MLVAVLVLIPLCTVLVLAARLRDLTRRVEALEQGGVGQAHRLLASMQEKPSPLAGLRFLLSIQQDHPHPVLATLLKEALLREDALIESSLTPLHLGRTGVHPSTDPPLPQKGEGFTISGTVVCNGYADVYFRADLAVVVEGQTILTVAEKPPHGDRQENLAREIVARLKAELEKRERHDALRELGRG